MERCRMVFSGSGGQGIITAAVIFAEAAVLYENLVAVQSQAYGPEARGGSTRSDIIISSSNINFPKVIQPNVLICLTQEAYNKFYSIIRPGGMLITDTRFVKTQKKVDAMPWLLPIVLEAVSKPHLRPNGCVASLFKMLTYSPCMLRFFIGFRLALKRHLRF